MVQGGIQVAPLLAEAPHQRASWCFSSRLFVHLMSLACLAMLVTSMPQRGSHRRFLLFLLTAEVLFASQAMLRRLLRMVVTAKAVLIL